MADDTSGSDDIVTVSMDIEGGYDEVMSKLRIEDSRPSILEPLLDEVDTLLETVERIDGGTRSAIAQALPEESSMAGDPDAVVETLQVLERYDLVRLEGNTWVPGEQLTE